MPAKTRVVGPGFGSRLLGIVSFVALLGAVAPVSAAGVTGTWASNFPAVIGASPFHVTMSLTDTSTDGDVHDLSSFKLVPSCYQVNGSGACTAWDSGVFTLSNPTGVNCGFPPPVTFAPLPGSLVEAPAGVWTFTGDPISDFETVPNPSIYKTCAVEFDVTVNGVPSHDANTGLGGIQTLQVMSATMTGFDLGNFATVIGSTTTTFNARPLFVIGDKEKHAVGDVVNFWGAQWWKNNQMTGIVDAGYPAFKGYADFADSTCPGTWTTLPGNSSDPPDTIPADVLVIVTDTVHKNGPNISGNIKQIVLVHSDGGYGPNPGHRGNGPVTQVVCP